MDGRITFRAKGQPSFNGSALPIFSVETEQEARSLMLLACTRSYLPGVYGIPEFPGTIEAIPDVQQRLTERYKIIRGEK